MPAVYPIAHDFKCLTSPDVEIQSAVVSIGISQAALWIWTKGATISWTGSISYWESSRG